MNIFRTYSQKSGVKKGFTLVELMVVISIIIIFVAIVLAAISTARENTREKRRVADLSQIELALALYKEKHRGYPVAPNAVEIGHGGALDSEIQQYIGNIPTDPKSEGEAGGTYSYWYDSDFLCKGKSMKVIYVKTMEQAKNSNFEEVCGGTALPYLFEKSKALAKYLHSHTESFYTALVNLTRIELIQKAFAYNGNCSLSASPTSLPYTGGTVTLNWGVFTYATGDNTVQGSVGFFNEGLGNVYGYTSYGTGSNWRSGTKNVTVNTTKTFTLTVESRVCSVTITVAPPPPPAVCDTFTVNPATLPYGGGTISLDWTTTNATAVSIDGGVGVVTPVDGTKPGVAVSATKTFTLTGTGTGGNCTKTATVSVGTTPPPATCDTFTVSPSTLPYGGGTVSLGWTTTNATAVSIDGGVGVVSPVDGSKSGVAVSASKTFTLSGTGLGASCTKSATVAVGTTPPVDTSAMYIVVLKE